MKRHVAVIFAVLAFTTVRAMAEDAYIQSDGTQVLNTGYHSGPKTKLVLDYALVSPKSDATTIQARLFAQEEDGSGFVTSAYIAGTVGKSDGNIACSFGDAWSGVWSSKGFDETRRELTLDVPHRMIMLKEAGETIFSTTQERSCTRTSTRPLFLCGRPADASGATGEYLSRLRIYGFKIYELDSLVHDFVPARKAGTFGLYDKVTGSFCRDSRWVGGSFTGGGDFLDLAEDGYIESTGTQVINLRRRNSATTRYEIDCALTDLTVQQRLIGSDAVTQGKLPVYINSGNGYSVCGYPFTGLTVDRNRHTIVVDAKGQKSMLVTGCTTNMAIDIVYDGKVCDSDFTVFARARTDGVFDQHCKLKVYGVKYYESDELELDLVPAVKGGVSGLFDVLSGAFFANVQRSDGATPSASGKKLTDFVTGGAIRQVEDDPYIESDYSQFINTGYHPNPRTRIELDYALRDVSTGTYPNGPVQTRLFGQEENSTLSGFRTTAYISGDTTFIMALGDTWAGGSSGAGYFDMRRRTIWIDAPKKGFGISEHDVTLYSGSSGATFNNTQSAWPLGLFGRTENAAATAYGQMAKIRVYSLKIYEAGSLIKDFRPFVKDGQAGLKDILSSEFLTDSRLSRAFKYGGTIGGVGAGDAYVSSTKQQMINLGYQANPKSRIEVDLAMNSRDAAGQERLFGATASTVANDLTYGLYCNGGSQFAFNLRDGSSSSGGYSSEVAVDFRRYTVVADLKNGKWTLASGDMSKETVMPVVGASASYPLCVFGDPTATDGSTARCLADARIYSVKVYEDDQLKFHFLPYRSGGQVGLIDVLTGAVKTDALTSGQPLAVGGCGWGQDHSAFYASPESCAVSADETVVLKAFAPAAIAYQWYRDGEPVVGATGMTLSVGWQKHVKSAVYAVRATFDVNGTEVVRESDAATVTMRPRGLSVIIR